MKHSFSFMLPDARIPDLWKLRHDHDALFGEQVRGLVDSLNLLPLTARILAARNLSDLGAAKNFLSPALASLHDPMGMRDMDRAVDRISQALRNGEKIAVFGDYDVDGLTATSLLIRFFKWMDVDALPYIPHRLNEGYGMSAKGVDILRQQGAKLIITVDNGISCAEEIAYAASLGIDVVVTDHHQPGETLPLATAVVDPNRPDCSYPFKSLSGVGVAFKLAHALAKSLKKPAENSKLFLKSMMDLVALGTVADMMPLHGENRVLVSHGLKALAETDKPGLRAMLKKLDLEDCRLNSDMVGFRIGPRLNAAGRTEDAIYSLNLLLSADAAQSQMLVDKLERMNQDRRDEEKRAYDEALTLIESDKAYCNAPMIVVYGENWHQGILGIVASKLTERFGLPSAVLCKSAGESTDGFVCAKGSARSIGDFNILAVLQECKVLLTAFGGHRMAAGLALPVERIPEFRTAVCRCAAAQVSKEQPVLQPVFTVDTVAHTEDLDLDMLEEMERLQPYGEGNPEPLVALTGCQLAEPPQLLKGKHVKIRFCQRNGSRAGRIMCGMAFGAGDRYDKIFQTGGNIAIAGVPVINEWNGNKSVEMNIRDIQSDMRG